jgi:hypothetical protein
LLLGRLASPTTAGGIGVLSLVLLFASIPLEFLIPQGFSLDAAQAVAWFVFGLLSTSVGVVVARREPRNPLGWLLLGFVVILQAGTDAPAYAYIDYTIHHGALPLGQVAVVVSGSWTYGALIIPLIILLFPDGRLGPRWRWPLRAYLAVCSVFAVGVLSVAIAALRLRQPIDNQGNLVGMNDPSHVHAWTGPVFAIGFLSAAVLAIASIVYQVRSYRLSTGERRQQLKWLGAGAATCVAILVIAFLWSSAPAIVGDVLFPLGLAALPLAIGVGILKYRLYEIDVIIRRTLVYTTLVGSLAVVYLAGIYLIDRALQAVTGQSGAFAVTLSTLAVAAMFQPLRRRIQHGIDHRFYRAKYDAANTLDAFTSRLRDQIDLDALHTEILNVINATLQPSHATLWIRPAAPNPSNTQRDASQSQPQ